MRSATILPAQAVLLLATAAFFQGCRARDRSAPRSEDAPGTRQARTETTYALTGVVRRVDEKAGLVTIRHDAIPGFMEAMTMPFAIRDRSVLAELKPGDEVQGNLVVVKEGGEVKDYQLSALVVTRPATTPLAVSLEGGELRLSSAPTRLEPGDLVPDFTMTTQEGKALRLSDLRGNVVAITFIYTRCPLPDFCPALDRKFAELADRLAANPKRAALARLLSVSFDPEHDTPSVLSEHAKMRGAKPPLWTFAVASHEELAKVAGALGLTYGPVPREIIHNLTTAIIDVDGRLARLESGKSWTVDSMLETMYSQIPRRKE